MSFSSEYLNNEITDKVQSANGRSILIENHGEVLVPIRNFRKLPCCILEYYINYAEIIKKFAVRQDDVWVITFPKCGTTLTQEMAWLIGNDGDFETAKNNKLADRFPMFELHSLSANSEKDTLKQIDQMKSPRFIKCHLPIELLPDALWTVKPKIIYVTRNPKDVAVSYRYHYKIIGKYEGSMEDFVNAFVHGYVLYGDVLQHIKNFWNLRSERNVLFVSFEEMITDLSRIIQKVSKFLDKTITIDDSKLLQEHLSFNKMKDNSSCNNQDLVDHYHTVATGRTADAEVPRFMRKGKIGSSKNELTEKEHELLDKWIEGHALEPALKVYLNI